VVRIAWIDGRFLRPVQHPFMVFLECTESTNKLGVRLVDPMAKPAVFLPPIPSHDRGVVDHPADVEHVVVA
jgi:hypothetical protein